MTLEGMSGRRSAPRSSSPVAGIVLRDAVFFLFLLEALAQPPAIDGPERGHRRRRQRLRRAAHADDVEEFLDLRKAGIGDAIHGDVADVLGLVLALAIHLAEQHLAS